MVCLHLKCFGNIKYMLVISLHNTILLWEVSTTREMNDTLGLQKFLHAGGEKFPIIVRNYSLNPTIKLIGNHSMKFKKVRNGDTGSRT